GEGEHEHVHVHIRDGSVGTSEHIRLGAHARHRHGAFAFGLLHGVAGTSHLVAALPALALGGAAAAAYIGGYLVAAVPLMALVGGAVVRMMDKPERVRPALFASGALAALIGVVWLGAAIG
ncbi:MAG: nickel transporter, partial [Myxococcota bacterium]